VLKYCQDDMRNEASPITIGTCCRLAGIRSAMSLDSKVVTLFRAPESCS
jgi:hypothetical protein